MATERNLRLSSFGDVDNDDIVVNYDDVNDDDDDDYDDNNNNNNALFKSEWQIYLPPALKLISCIFFHPVCQCASNFPEGAVTIRVLRIFPWLVL